MEDCKKSFIKCVYSVKQKTLIDTTIGFPEAGDRVNSCNMRLRGVT